MGYRRLRLTFLADDTGARLTTNYMKACELWCSQPIPSINIQNCRETGRVGAAPVELRNAGDALRRGGGGLNFVETNRLRFDFI
jgi:hypothetical protein